MKFKTNGKIRDIYSSNLNNKVFLCGDFSKIGDDISANKLAMIDYNFKYYGTQFFKMENFDSNIFDNYKINTVLSFDNKLVVGGYFFEIGNKKANHIAMFDLETREWECLGDSSNNGVNSEVFTIKYFDNKLVIGGLFSVANNKASSSGVVFPEIAANNLAIYDLTDKKWYSMSDSNSPSGGGVNQVVYCLDIIENSNDTEIYVGGAFRGVNRNGSPNLLANTCLLAKFTLRSLSNNNLNTWAAVLNLSDLYNNNGSYTPKINVINSLKGLIGGKFCGKPQVLINNNNTNNVYNIFQYSTTTIFRVGTLANNYMDFTDTTGCTCSSVKDILFYTENKAFIAGEFNRVSAYSYIAKFDNSTKIVSALEDSNDKPNFPINALTWVDNCYEDIDQNLCVDDEYKARIGRLFIGNNCITTKKLIYNIPLENIVLTESWSYSFYDILDNASNNTVSLENYLNECVFGKNSFQFSYYDCEIKPYLRNKYNCFIKNNSNNRVDFVNYYIKRLDSLIQIYAQSFTEKCDSILFCLIIDSHVIVDLGNLINPPYICYFTCNDGEIIDIKIKGVMYSLEYHDGGGIDRTFSYQNQEAGVGEEIIFKQSTNESVYIDGVGSVLAEFYCLTKNTTILTPLGYIPIYNLKIGDIVITDDNRKVKITNILKEIYPPIKLLKPYLIEKNSIDKNYPPQNVELSGGHLIKYKNKWICPKLFKSFKQIETDKDIEYYHIELENYEKDNLVINGGCVVESYSGESEYNRIIYNNRLKNKKISLNKYK